jgi:hypothetical protein
MHPYMHPMYVGSDEYIGEYPESWHAYRTPAEVAAANTADAANVTHNVTHTPGGPLYYPKLNPQNHVVLSGPCPACGTESQWFGKIKDTGMGTDYTITHDGDCIR